MNSVRLHLGVDVGKDFLDVCYPDEKKEQIKNTKSCRGKLIAKALKLGAIVSFEATGPYDEKLAEECLAKGAKAVRLDAWKVRKYAESQGRIEKTDRIDCEMIRDFAMSVKEADLHCLKVQSEARRQLRELVRVRKNAMKARAILNNQLECNISVETKAKIESLVRRLDKEIAKLEAACDDVIAKDPEMAELSRRFLEVKGVGPCLVRTVLAYCPDIGEFNSKSIAKICGNAPIDYESCTIKKTARPKRGRGDLRMALYMAAISASQSNHILKVVYKRLRDKGKPPKVALMAVARHLAIVLNDIAKHPDFKPEQDEKETK